MAGQIRFRNHSREGWNRGEQRKGKTQKELKNLVLYCYRNGTENENGHLLL